MHIQVQKWGNSLAFRIPRSFACEAAITQGTTVDLGIHDGCLTLSPVKAKVSLKDLLTKVTPTNIHHEADFGIKDGLETW